MLDALRSRASGVDLTNDAAILDAYAHDWSRARVGTPVAVAFPREIEQVQALVRACAELGVAVVPSGGRTGLSGGAVAADGELVLSLDRMNRAGPVDAASRLVRLGAGVVTGALQQQAVDAGLFYPVDFAASGSSQIGGNVATNAGGIRVVRYGMTRDWVAGLQFVTGTGDVVEVGRGLVKDASGPDWKQLLIGSEGIFGVITEVQVRLAAQAPPQQVMLLAVEELDAVLPLLELAQRRLTVSAFEYFSDYCLQVVLEHRGVARPLDSVTPHYVLLEADEDEEAAMVFFEEAATAGLVVDGAISQSAAQAQDLWTYREAISEALTPQRPYKNDIAVPVAQVTAFLVELDEIVKAHYPDVTTAWFGHVGDGNLHLNIMRPESWSEVEFVERCEHVNELVFELINRLGGSISAEHGIGTLKRRYLDRSRSAAEIEWLRTMKAALDPAGIMNPGKVLL